MCIFSSMVVYWQDTIACILQRSQKILSLLAASQNHNKLHSPAALDLVLGEAGVTVFAVETTCGDVKVEVERK